MLKSLESLDAAGMHQPLTSVGAALPVVSGS